MSKRKKIPVMLAGWFAVTVAGAHVAAAENAAATGHSLTDSPYKNGPPPVSGGYTDTTQGGTKTSGDMPVAPPSQSGKAVTSGQGQKDQGSTQQPAPRGGKPAASSGSPG